MSKRIILVFLVIGITTNIFCAIHANDIVPIFDDESSQILIEKNIVNGSKHYFKAKAYLNLLLAEIEKAPLGQLNYQTVTEFTNSALNELEISIDYYKKAVNIGKNTNYSTSKRSLFNNFDYEKFILESKLNSPIANIVVEYLKNSDITGIYEKNISNLEGIKECLLTIKSNLSVGKIEIPNFWMLIQIDSECAMFGNYSTVIAKEVLSN